MPFQQYHKLRVLVLDDFDGFRSTVSRMFESFGVPKVDTANTAEEALAMCQGGYYDAILSDYNLGKGQTGLQLLEKLRHQKLIDSSQVFVLVSAENSKEIVLAASDVEPDAYLSKPITVKMLQHRLDRILVQRSELSPLFRAIDRSDFNRAIAVCQDYIASRGHQTAFCQKYLGKLLIETNALREAEAVYRSVLEVRPLEWAKIGMAQVKQKRGDCNTAERWFRELITANPLCLKAYDGLADVYTDLDDEISLQKVLEQAVTVSPLALLRQEKLAVTATNNSDFFTAARAYRKVIRLADFSVYKSSQHNLEYARTALRLTDSDAKSAMEFGRDAIQKLSALDTDLDGSSVHLQSLLLKTQLFIQQQDRNRAEQQFEATCHEIDKQSEAELAFDVEVEMVKTMRCIGQQQQADKLLLELCDSYRDDEPRLEVLDSLLDEPRSAKNRKIIAGINKEGIRQYQAKQYPEAIKSFEYAQRLFPNHVGVQLNLVQVLLEEMTQFGCKKEVLEQVDAVFNNVSELINPTHTQYRRLVKLKEMHQSLARSV